MLTARTSHVVTRLLEFDSKATLRALLDATIRRVLREALGSARCRAKLNAAVILIIPGCLAADAGLSAAFAVADTEPVRVTVIIQGNEKLALGVGAVDAQWWWGSKLLRLILVQRHLLGRNDLLHVIFVQWTTALCWKALRIAQGQRHALNQAGATHGMRCAYVDVIFE